MRRIVLFLSVAAVVAAMLAASALPALANERNDNDRHDNIVRIGDNDRHDHLDNRLERRIDRFDFFDDGSFFPLVDDDVADELCSPLNSDAVNDLVPGCIFD